LSAWKILSLAKLRAYQAAADELAAIGDLDDPRYGTGDDGASAVPHALRVLEATLPGLRGRHAEAKDRAYALADRCDRAARERDASATTRADARDDGGASRASSSSGDAAAWRRRRDAAYHLAINAHVAAGEHVAALARLDWMARCLPAGASERPRLLSLAGRIHLRAGDERGAELCFAEAEKAREEASSDGRRGGGDGHEGDVDAGLVHVAKREYGAALERFERAAAARPWDAAAANGSAVARMYAGDLRRGARALEEALTIHPRGALGDGEALVRNACSMYELAAAAPSGAKKTLAAWAAKIAPDDFNPQRARLA
jgi:tetratricopeptide (TPR) repeat protein